MKKTITVTGLVASAIFALAGYMIATQEAMADDISMPQNLSKQDEILAIELNRTHYVMTYGLSIDELRSHVMASSHQVIQPDGSLKLN